MKVQDLIKAITAIFLLYAPTSFADNDDLQSIIQNAIISQDRAKPDETVKIILDSSDRGEGDGHVFYNNLLPGCHEDHVHVDTRGNVSFTPIEGIDCSDAIWFMGGHAF